VIAVTIRKARALAHGRWQIRLADERLRSKKCCHSYLLDQLEFRGRSVDVCPKASVLATIDKAGHSITSRLGTSNEYPTYIPLYYSSPSSSQVFISQPTYCGLPFYPPALFPQCKHKKYIAFPNLVFPETKRNWDIFRNKDPGRRY
jgi:hypothetical protein